MKNLKKLAKKIASDPSKLDSLDSLERSLRENSTEIKFFSKTKQIYCPETKIYGLRIKQTKKVMCFSFDIFPDQNKENQPKNAFNTESLISIFKDFDRSMKFDMKSHQVKGKTFFRYHVYFFFFQDLAPSSKGFLIPSSLKTKA